MTRVGGVSRVTAPGGRKPGILRLTTRVFDSATRGTGARLDAYREGDSFFIDIDLPGIDPASIDITVDRKVLSVRAERKPVSRQVFLSDSLDTDRLDARYDNGVLTLSIPVTEKAKPRKFEVAAV
jgi:HSP20 family protein